VSGVWDTPVDWIVQWIKKLPVPRLPAYLPPVLAGRLTPEVATQVRNFYASIAGLFELWVERRVSEHTQRAHRDDILGFARFMGWRWPDEASELLRVSIVDVHAFKSHLREQKRAPKTINRRIASLLSLHKYLGATAGELRLPVTVSNPAHAQFISRDASDPCGETKALSAAKARPIATSWPNFGKHYGRRLPQWNTHASLDRS
jgi:hypothetical protein